MDSRESKDEDAQSRTPRAANGGGGRGGRGRGTATVLIIFEIDGPADVPIKQTNKFLSEADALAYSATAT